MIKSKQANCFWCGRLCDKTYRIMMEELLAVTKKPKYLCEKCQKQLHDDRYPTKSGQNSTNNGPIPPQVKEEKMVCELPFNPYVKQLHPELPHCGIYFLHPLLGVHFWAEFSEGYCAFVPLGDVSGYRHVSLLKVYGNIEQAYKDIPSIITGLEHSVTFSKFILM